MERDENYYDYSAKDAPDHLFQALEHFFDTEQNPYKFTLPKKHFNALKRDSDFPDANRIFKIITGTTLVTNKTILRYRTAQGLRYMINKEFSQNARRAQRAQRRTQIRENTTPPPTSNEPATSGTPPFVQLMEQKRNNPLDYSSDEDTDTEKEQQTSKDDKPASNIDHPQETSPQSSDQDKDYDNCTIESDVTKQADELEKNLDAAVAQLKADQNTDQDHDALQEKFSDVLKNLIQDELSQCRQEYKAKEALLDSKILDIERTKAELLNVLQDSKRNHEKLLEQNDKVAKKILYFTRNIDDFTMQLNTLKSTESAMTENILRQTETHTKKVCAEHYAETYLTADTTSRDNLQRTTDTIVRKLTRLKEGTKILFQQTEDDYELLSERILHVEQDVHNIQDNMKLPAGQTPTNTSKRHHLLSDSDDSHNNNTPHSSNFVTPQQSTSRYQRTYNPSTKSNTRQYNIPNMTI